MAESRASEILKENEWQIGPLKGDSSKLSFPVNTVAVPKLYNPSTVKLGIKELLNKEQIGFKELLIDYQLFYTINLQSNKELLLI